MYSIGLNFPNLPLDRGSTAWTESSHAPESDPIFCPYVKSTRLISRELALLVRNCLPEEKDLYELGNDRWRRTVSDLGNEIPHIIFTNELNDDKLEDVPKTSYICRMKKIEGILEGTAILRPEARYKYLSQRLALVHVEFLQPREADKDDQVTASRNRR